MESKINHIINEQRLWNSIHELAKIGEIENGGVRRLAYSEDDQSGRTYFIDCCRTLGMSIEHDAIGNLFARLDAEGVGHDNASIMVGSHLDSQLNGGKYDGSYGVMCGLEIARALYEHNIKLTRPFEIVVWANEEGARFAPPMMGSGTFVGHFVLNEMLSSTDLNGVSVADALTADQLLNNIAYRTDRPISAYLESHIEQGPILEKEKKIVGIVTGAQAVVWLNICVEGFQAHAGPTPMDYRKDAFLAAAEVALVAEQTAIEQGPLARMTIGQSIVDNPSRNVIPGKVELWIDIRHPDEKILEKIVALVKIRAADIATKRQVIIQFEPVWEMSVTHFTPFLINALRTAAKLRNVDAIDIVSGAGHDALYMATKYPTAMLFIPCKNGISHNESENIDQGHAAKGCQILYDVVLPLLTGKTNVT